MRTLLLVLGLTFAACKGREAAPPAATPTPPGQEAAGPTVPAPPIPARSQWTLDPENSSVQFACKHVLTRVRGMLQRPNGTVTFDETTPAQSSVSASVEVGTITTGVEERDSHLKSAEFFDAAKFPTLSFASTQVSRSSPSTFSVMGDLTMHGITKPVTLAVTASAPFAHAGGIRRGIEATTSVNRRDFGLVWDFPGEGAGVVVGDTVAITIDAELVLSP